LAFGLFLASVVSVRAAPGFSTALDRDTIDFGETATFSLVFEDCSPQAEPSLPAIAGLEFSGGSMMESHSFVNGVSTASITYSFEVRPTRPGDFTIPALRASTDKGPFASQLLRLRVVKGNLQQPAGVPETAFLRLIPSTNRVYVGQTFPVNLQCYCQDNVGNPQLPQFEADGFIVGNVPNRTDQTHVRVGDVMYHLFDFRVPVTATRSGKLSLGPATWSMTVYSGQRTVFGWTGGAHQGNFTSDTPEIKVLPIPTAGAPANFRGAIGEFSLTQCEAGPTDVGVGDPITLKIRIEGQGAFDTVTLPASEPGWREFKTYPPMAKFDSSDPLQVHGSKYFEQVIAPLNAQVTEIPAFSFSYFNPESAGFRVLTHPAISLKVHPVAATPQPTVFASAAQAPDAQQNQDIVHIKPRPGPFGEIGAPLIRQPLYLTLLAIPPLAWALAALWRRQKDKLAANPRLRRRRETASLVREGLEELSRLAAANEVEKFYSTVLRLIQEQLGERLDLPAPAITEAVLEDCKGLDAGAIAAARDLFHACEQYRYTPEHTAQELASLIPKVKAVLDVLRRIPDADGSRRRTVAQGVGVVLLMAGALTARADAVSEPFEQANKLYEEGHYAQAAAGYENLLHNRSISAAIYFNAGNAWFKAGQIGRAIYSYRRAEELAPRDPDIRANLEIARTQAGTTASLPGNRWTRWVGRLTLTEWTISASASVALFFFVLTARQLSPRFNKSAGGLTLTVAACSVWLVACLGLSIEQRLLEQSSIIIVSEAVARRGPMDESQSAFTVHDGAELTVQGRDGDWLQVTSAARQVGWLPQKDVALIP
jgi:tetratricopeptide (TPR) repeat protein